MSKYKYVPTICYFNVTYKIGDYIIATINNRDKKNIIISTIRYCGEITEITENYIVVKSDIGEKRGISGKFLISDVEDIVQVYHLYDYSSKNYDTYGTYRDIEIGSINCKDDADMFSSSL